MGRKNIRGLGASAACLNDQGKPMLDALSKDSERGQVLIAATFIDNALKGCIVAMCKQHKVNSDVMRIVTGYHGAILGSFGAKIPVCRAFGMIDEELYSVLEAIHEIRNSFAHKDFKITLRSQEVKKHIDRLRKWLSSVEMQSYYEDRTGAKTPGWIRDLECAGETVASHPSQRHIFLGAATMLYMMLHNIRWAIRKEEFTGGVCVTMGQRKGS